MDHFTVPGRNTLAEVRLPLQYNDLLSCLRQLPGNGQPHHAGTNDDCINIQGFQNLPLRTTQLWGTEPVYCSSILASAIGSPMSADDQSASNSSHPYDDLTPDRILDAVEGEGFPVSGRLFALNSYENRVYQVGLDDQPPVIAKFYRPGRWSEDQIREEHSFSLELAEAGVPVVAPLPLASGDTLGREGPFLFALFPSVVDRHRIPAHQIPFTGWASGWASSTTLATGSPFVTGRPCRSCLPSPISAIT